MSGVSGGGKPFIQGPQSKTVVKGKAVSAGSKSKSGQTVQGGVPGAKMPAKSVASPTGFKAMGKNGKGAHAGVATGPGKPGTTKK